MSLPQGSQDCVNMALSRILQWILDPHMYALVPRPHKPDMHTHTYAIGTHSCPHTYSIHTLFACHRMCAHTHTKHTCTKTHSHHPKHKCQIHTHVCTHIHQERAPHLCMCIRHGHQAHAFTCTHTHTGHFLHAQTCICIPNMLVHTHSGLSGDINVHFNPHRLQELKRTSEATQVKHV
jgi:hypothetical protein